MLDGVDGHVLYLGQTRQDLRLSLGQRRMRDLRSPAQLLRTLSERATRGIDFGRVEARAKRPFSELAVGPASLVSETPRLKEMVRDDLPVCLLRPRARVGDLLEPIREREVQPRPLRLWYHLMCDFPK